MLSILLLHGALGAADTLRPLARSFTAKGYQVIVADLPGHGSSPAVGPEMRMENLATAALAMLDEAGVEKAHVFGYSMGGYLGAHLALTHPDRIRSVATLATIWNWNSERAEKECRGLNPDKVLEKVPQLAESLRERHTAHPWSELMHKTASMLRALGDAPLLSSEDFGRMQQRMLVAVGDRDRTVSIEETTAVYRALPLGHMAVLPRVAHSLESAPPELLRTLLDEFFRADA